MRDISARLVFDEHILYNLHIMAMLCDYCGRGIMYGNLVSHAKNRTKRTFKPNLHTKRVKIGTRTMKAKLCSSCIKLLKKANVTPSTEATTTAS